MTVKALTPEEVVKVYPALTKSIGTLANWRSRGVGPRYYRVGSGAGRRIAYRPEDIEAVLFSNPVLTADSIAGARP